MLAYGIFTLETVRKLSLTYIVHKNVHFTGSLLHSGGFMAKVYRYDLSESLEAIAAELMSKKEILSLLSVTVSEEPSSCTITLSHPYEAVYGLGERFNQVNQKGNAVTAEVIEKFCNQGSISYCPVPFFFTDHKLGVFIDTFTVTEYDFGEEISIKIAKDSKGQLPVIYFFHGAPAEILQNFSKITGKPALIPKWSLGPWMSANRWNTQEEVMKQLEYVKKYNIPHSVMVIEAWSDEATFYLFNGHGEWKDPKEMVQLLLDKGIHLLLWQIPVLKRMEHGERNELLEQDWEYAVKNKLCILNSDGTPYQIPENHWFAGSLLPDFTNPKAVAWWFEKRKYLLEMGVAGFKTDGGEFILRDDILAANGCTGLEMRNQYASSYVEAYSRFIGKDRVLFSRAGYKGQQRYPIQWAGDQMSTWEEFRHILAAGLSIGLSGVPFWSFDIAGFAGPMPSLELYERATQLSVFTPVMQWHSEPVGGQFSELLASTEGVNDRSPWNISKLYKDESILERLRYHYNLRMNLLPYLYHQGLVSCSTGLPMMKHLIVEYPEDKKVIEVEDCYMLGDLLIAPILEEEKTERIVYLPEGNWIGLWQFEVEALEESGLVMMNSTKDQHTATSLRLKGGSSYRIRSGKERIPVFLREGGCIALNLDDSLTLGSDVGNKTSGYQNLCFYVTGPEGEYHFQDDENNEIHLSWRNGFHRVHQSSGNVEITVIDK